VLALCAADTLDCPPGVESIQDNARRYDRQVIFEPLGLKGQQALRAGRALIVGVGGLGSWTAELLARAGVGKLRLVDDDKVDWTNLHRQTMYDEDDARAMRPKAQAAAEHLARINSSVSVEPIVERLTARNIADLAKDANVICDGTDNFAARFVINDYSVKFAVPWIFAGVVGAEAQIMSIVPGRGACLRCIFDAPPPPCMAPTCRGSGVLGPAVASVAAMQAAEAMKILAGRGDAVSGYLTKLDLWTNTVQRIDAASACKNVKCPCCKGRDFEFLEA